jgi:hypothetical protein
MKCQGEVAVYRFYNYEQSKYGEPFALCEAHKKEQPVPRGCMIAKLAEKALQHCIKLGEDE